MSIPMPVDKVIDLLVEAYGDRSWHSHNDPTSELIRTILSQHTSDANSWRAFHQLMDAFGGWEAVAEADVEDIARAIWPGGLARVKAPRIKKILQQIREQTGTYDLSFLADLPLPDAKAWLRELPGVGPKTAGCVLMFSLGRPALPVDTHVYRVSKRLGLIDATNSADDAHEILEKMVAPADVYRFHVLMVEHGRRTCKAQRPLCDHCILEPGCPSSWLKVGK